MPISSRKLSRGIYLHQWQGRVTSEEVVEAAALELAWLAEDGLATFVVIADCSELRSYPTNIEKLRKTFRGDEIGILVYKASPLVKKLGKIFALLTKASMEFYDDWDLAMARAQEIIQNADAED